MIDQIYLDLDGVLADFPKSAKILMGNDYEKLSNDDFWKYVNSVDHIFLHLDPMPKYKTLLNYLESTKIPLAILTAIPRPTGNLKTAEEDKIAWVRKHLSETIPVITVIGGSNKAKYATPTSLLIDDLKSNIDAFIQAGGQAILHTSISRTIVDLHTIL